MRRGRGLFELALRAVPDEWRASVRRDLLEEAEEGGTDRHGPFWLAGQALMVGARFHFRRMTEGKTMDGWIGGKLGSDARMAWRSMGRRPGWALAVVGILGLGIGGVTATYAVFNHVVFRPVPGVADPDRMVTLYYQPDPSTPTRVEASLAHLEAMRDGSDALDGLAAWSRRTAGFGSDAAGADRDVAVTAVTAGYFELLGARFRAGRAFSEEEYADGRAVLVVSEAFAREALGDVPSALGRTVYLNGRLHEIVGVVADFRGLDRLGRDDLWLPHRATLAVGVDSAPSDPPGVFAMVGRLRAGASLEQAREQVRRASREVGPLTRRSTAFEPTLFAGLTDGIGLTENRLRRMYGVLMAGVSTLLLLACANAANMVLARNVRRRRDLAMRAALGAGRGRLLRELTVESAALAAAAGAVGLLAGWGLTQLFRGARLLPFLPALEEVALDVRVMAFCAGAAAVTLLLSGVVPALPASRADLRGGLRDASRATPRTGWPGTVLVTAQLALSMALLTGAGLLGRTAWRLHSLESGMDTENVVGFEIRPYRIRPDDARTEAVLRQTRERMAALPRVDAVAVAWDGPFGSHQSLPVAGPDASGGDPTPELLHYVTAGYFEVLRIPVLAGRTFGDVDEATAGGPVRPVVVNEAFARKWFGTSNAVGRTVAARDPSGDITLDIVGVVGNARTRELRDGFVPAVYHPAAGHLRRATVLVRTELTPDRVRELARGVLHEMDPLLPVSSVATVDDQIATILAEERLLARLGSAVAILAALLAVAGLYAVVAFSVSTRVREFAIRMSLGASGASVAAQVLRRVAGLTAVGIALGVGLVLVASPLLAGRLYGVGPRDPLTLVSAAVALTAAALLAAWLPTRRATRIDPMASLRVE